jgi:hypothetical protein
MVKDLSEDVFRMRDELDIKGFYLISDLLKEEEALKFIEFGSVDRDYISIFANLSNEDTGIGGGGGYLDCEGLCGGRRHVLGPFKLYISCITLWSFL